MSKDQSSTRRWRSHWGAPQGPPDTWGRGKRHYHSKNDLKREPRGALCPFCGTNSMATADENDVEPRIVWRCPLGCGAEYPLCRNCFPEVHHQPHDTQLVRWDAIHMTSGCSAPENFLADDNATGKGGFALRAPPKDLRRYAALLAAEVYEAAPDEVGHDLRHLVRVAARGQLVQAEDWRRALVQLPLIDDDTRHWPAARSIEVNPRLSCALAAAALQIVTQAKIHRAGQRHAELPRGQRYLFVAEDAAAAAGVSALRRVELQVHVQIGRWSLGEPVSQDVRDAAVAAVFAGKDAFARKLVAIHANDLRKRKSAGG